MRRKGFEPLTTLIKGQLLYRTELPAHGGDGAIRTLTGVTPNGFRDRGRRRSAGVSKVGLAGFEPAASASRTRRSTKLSHSPLVGMGSLELPSSCPPDKRATPAPHPDWCPREESNPDLRFRRPASYPLDHKGLVPSAGLEPAVSALSERCRYHFGLDGLAEGAGIEPAPV